MQKTAYEMRISDWSSDVCSSDLALPGAQLPQPGVGLVPQADGLAAEALQLLEEAHVARMLEPLVEEALGRGQHDAAVAVVLDLRVGAAIGRASWREKVCQYV